MNTLKEAFESGKLVPYNDILTGKMKLPIAAELRGIP